MQQRRIAAILFSDIMDYTALLGKDENKAASNRTFIIALQFILCVLLVMCCKIPERFSCKPENPVPGQEINIRFHPSGTILEDRDEIILTAYCFPKGTPVLKQTLMEKSHKIWHGSFTTTDSSLVVYIVIGSGEHQDDNNQLAFFLPLFTADKKPVRCGMARQAEIAFFGSPCLPLLRDWKMAQECLRKEFEFYPDQVLKLVNSYWYPMDNIVRDSARQIMIKYLDKTGLTIEENQDESSYLFNWYKEIGNYKGINGNDSTLNFLDRLLWVMLKGEIIIEKAVELAEIAVEEARIAQKTSKKPERYTSEEWQEKMNRNLAETLDTYGFYLYTLGRNEESVPVFEEAVELDHRQNKVILESYCRSLYETGQIGKAYTELELLVRAYPRKPELRTLFEEVFIEWKGSDEGLKTFFEEAEKANRSKITTVIKGEMIEKPAPLFSLKDLEGNIIRLADYRDNIVILDFWATWCGPCIAWFPTMQILVDRYKDDDRVKFFFIDTFERREKAVNKVKELIDQNKYTFNVLFDVDSCSVSTAYGLSGIPSLFIIDQRGYIRFRPEHSGLNEKEFVEHIEVMIDLLR